MNYILPTKKVKDMTVLTDQNRTRLFNNSSYIDKVIGNINQEKFEVNLSIEHLKSIPLAQMTEAERQELNSLGDRQAEIYQQLSTLDGEWTRAKSLELNRLGRERIMRESEKSIEVSRSFVAAEKLTWLEVHGRNDVKSSYPISQVCDSFYKLHSAVKKLIAGESIDISSLNSDFDNKMIEVLGSVFKCRAERECHQVFLEIKGCKRAMMKSLFEYFQAYHERQEFVSKERAAYARISQEYKIEP